MNHRKSVVSQNGELGRGSYRLALGQLVIKPGQGLIRTYKLNQFLAQAVVLSLEHMGAY